MKKLLLLALTVFASVALLACATTAAPTTVAPTTVAPTSGSQTTVAPTTAAPTTASAYVQGVTATSIKVGNTASTTGFLAFVGVPFNDAIRAVFKEVNDAGGINGRMIEFVTYDDQSDAAKGVTFTETLVETDKIFALVGHFGTGTVNATLPYIQTKGVPMVYAATGVNALYFAQSVGNPVLAVQPIYLTDGRIMAARALKENLYGANQDQPLAANAKVGVLYTNDDVGNSIKAGIEIEATALGKAANFTYTAVTSETVSSSVTLLKGSGVDVVILAMNQGPFAYTLTAMFNASLNVPIFTSYVNADVTAVNHIEYSPNRPIYTNAWVDVFSTKGQADVQAFVATIAQAALPEATKTAYYTNSFAIAGYIAATVFVEGLKRVGANDLTWASYIAAMENGPISIPMGGVVDFSNGHRWGIAAMSLLKYTFVLGDNPATPDVVETTHPIESFIKVREIETIAEIEAK